MDTQSKRRLVIYRPPGPAACRHQLAGDRPGLIRGQEDRDERDLRSIHHAILLSRPTRLKVGSPLGEIGDGDKSCVREVQQIGHGRRSGLSADLKASIPLFDRTDPSLRSLIAAQKASGFSSWWDAADNVGTFRRRTLGSQRSGRHGEVKPAAAFGGGSKSQA
jgi:hypothetical protein